VDSKAEYTAYTRSQKLKQTNTRQCPFNSIQVKIHEISPALYLPQRWMNTD